MSPHKMRRYGNV